MHGYRRTGCIEYFYPDILVDIYPGDIQTARAEQAGIEFLNSGTRYRLLVCADTSKGFQLAGKGSSAVVDKGLDTSHHSPCRRARNCDVEVLGEVLFELRIGICLISICIDILPDEIGEGVDASIQFFVRKVREQGADSVSQSLLPVGFTPEPVHDRALCGWSWDIADGQIFKIGQGLSHLKIAKSLVDVPADPVELIAVRIVIDEVVVTAANIAVQIDENIVSSPVVQPAVCIHIRGQRVFELSSGDAVECINESDQI